MNTQERLSAFLTQKHLNYKEFEQLAGLGQSSASRLSEKSTPRTFKRISDAFPDLNIDWLRFGEGEMLRSINQSATGNNNVQVAGDNNHITATETIDRLLAHIEAQQATIQSLTESVARLTAKLC